MTDPKNELQKLFDKSEWTVEDKKWLMQYLDNNEGKELQALTYDQFLIELENAKLLSPEASEKLLAKIHSTIEGGKQTKPGKTAVVRLWTVRIAAASLIGILLATGGYLILKNRSRVELVKTAPKFENKNDVAPGDNRATLTLADGSTINLDESSDGSLAQQGNVKVLKLHGKLFYSPQTQGKNTVLFNTISTPRGGQFQIELADGSKVWLNAASSIRFPTAFAGKERKVEVTGEAYFEVAKNKAMPFIVNVNNAEVRVLGTHFNVMAYQEEDAVKTTLLEGSVKFISGNSTNMLKPGQQSQLEKTGQVRVVSNIDVDEVVAWKNELFSFQGEDIASIMRQISRWYDVEVVFKTKMPEELFQAEIPRNTKLSDVLKVLEIAGKVHFEIQGKKINVMP